MFIEYVPKFEVNQVVFSLRNLIKFFNNFVNVIYKNTPAPYK